jgi:hypothetical protein
MNVGVHNGVICRDCFRTIDLTALDKYEKIGEMWVLERLRGDRFFLSCPHCKARYVYLDEEVKPLDSWEKAEGRLSKRMDKLEKGLKDPRFISDVAKAVMKIAQKEAEKEQTKQKEGENPLAK